MTTLLQWFHSFAFSSTSRVHVPVESGQCFREPIPDKCHKFSLKIREIHFPRSGGSALYYRHRSVAGICGLERVEYRVESELLHLPQRSVCPCKTTKQTVTGSGNEKTSDVAGSRISETGR